MTISSNRKQFSFCAILLAAGKSKRFKCKTKKQFLKINTKTLVEYVLDQFCKINCIKQFILVVPKEDLKKVKKIFKQKEKYRNLNLNIIPGGKERYHSVYNAIKWIDKNCNYVLIHDVARPFITEQLINRCIKEVKNYDCVIPAIKIYDTVKLVNSNSEVIRTLDRDSLVLVQTPQVFKKEVIKKIYSMDSLKKYTNLFNITDDAQLAELNGFKVKVVDGEKYNIKITTKEDLYLIKYLIRKQ